jgi:hypothetical protein
LLSNKAKEIKTHIHSRRLDFRIIISLSGISFSFWPLCKFFVCRRCRRRTRISRIRFVARTTQLHPTPATAHEVIANDYGIREHGIEKEMTAAYFGSSHSAASTKAASPSLHEKTGKAWLKKLETDT